MKLDPLSSVPARWIFVACVAGSMLTSTLPAQDTQQPQGTQQQPQAHQPPPPSAQDAQQEITVNDHTRTFLVHLPQGYDSHQTYPVVVLLHGRDQDAAEMARLTHFDEFADRDSIIAVYPNAPSGRWNIGVGEGQNYRRGPYRRYPPPQPRSSDRREHHNPDIPFLSRMLDKLATRYSVDTRRIYAAGLGEGGFMALRLGCSMADRFAAVAAVAAAMPESLTCVPSRPIPVLFMNGTDDPIVHYDGGRYKDGSMHLLSAEDSLKEWSRLNRCSGKPAESKLPSLQKGGKDTKVLIFDDCQERAQVALYSVKGGGHTWPGGEQYLPEKEVGKTSAALNANETIWSFLVTRKIATESGTEK
jgi:polyhydroxybutyrate depolymerase